MIIIQGCVISQQNPSLTHALSLLTTNHVSNASTLLLSNLLSWSQLPTLLKLNSERLSTSYRLLSALLTKHSIEFIPPSHGLFLFARLGKRATSADEEKVFFEEMGRDVRLKVNEGRHYSGVEGKYGWARVTFSLAPATMREGLERLDAFLGKKG
jgi:DNA-binding transcriptional MocR family regulator